MNFDTKKITEYHTPLIELSRDVFVFSYLGCGINFIDIAYVYLQHSFFATNVLVLF